MRIRPALRVAIAVAFAILLLTVWRDAHAYSPLVVDRVTLDPNQSNPHALVRMQSTATSNQYLFVCLLTIPARLVRLNPLNLTAARSEFEWPADGHHDQCTELRYRAADNRLYASFLNGLEVKVARIDPDAMTATDVITDAAGSVFMGFGSMALSTSYLYAAAGTAPSQLVRYRLSDFGRQDAVTFDINHNSAHAIEVDPNTDTAFVTGSQTTPWIARTKPDPNNVLQIQQQATFTATYSGPTDDLAIDPAFVYVGFENTANVAAVSRADVSAVTQVPVSAKAVQGTFYTGGLVWAMINPNPLPGKIAQITPGILSVAEWTAPVGLSPAGFNEYATDGTYQYVTTFTNPAQVFRLLPGCP